MSSITPHKVVAVVTIGRDNPFRIGRSKRYIGLVLSRTYRKIYCVVVYYPCMEEFERVVSRRSCEFSAPAGFTTTAISVLKFGGNKRSEHFHFRVEVYGNFTFFTFFSIDNHHPIGSCCTI